MEFSDDSSEEVFLTNDSGEDAGVVDIERAELARRVVGEGNDARDDFTRSVHRDGVRDAPKPVLGGWGDGVLDGKPCEFTPAFSFCHVDASCVSCETSSSGKRTPCAQVPKRICALLVTSLTHFLNCFI